MKNFKKEIIKNKYVLADIDINGLVCNEIHDIVYCKKCNTAFNKIYLSEQSDKIIEEMQNYLNDFIRVAKEEIIAQYGENIYIKFLSKKLNKLKVKYNKGLKIIK